jgi:hypothetical protein
MNSDNVLKIVSPFRPDMNLRCFADVLFMMDEGEKRKERKKSSDG